MNDGSILIEDARIIFRNFAGREGKYNREGDRNFAVLLDEDVAEKLSKDGWNVKWLAAREEGDEDQAYMSVSVGFKGRPPKLCMITSKGRTFLGEEECEVFDWVDIKTVDLLVRPYEWSVSGKSGIKAYLRSMFLTVDEDYLDLKYADVDDYQAGGEE